MPIDFNTMLDQILAEGQRLSGIENQNRERGLAFQQREFERSNAPTITDDDISRMFSAKAGDAAKDANEGFRQARSALGEAGIYGGGLARSTGSEIALRRMGQLSGSRASLRLFKAQSDAADRQSRLRNAFALGESMSAPPSILGLDSMSDVAGARVGWEGVQAEREAARAANKTNRKNGVLGLFGSVLAAF